MSVLMFKLSEAENICGVNQSLILQFISDHWITPADPINLNLDEEDIERIRLICELKEDLGVNDEAVPIILHLIDQLNHLHRSMKNN